MGPYLGYSYTSTDLEFHGYLQLYCWFTLLEARVSVNWYIQGMSRRRARTCRFSETETTTVQTRSVSSYYKLLDNAAVCSFWVRATEEEPTACVCHQPDRWWVTTDAETKVRPMLRIQSYRFFSPGEGENIALYASPTARILTILIIVFPGSFDIIFFSLSLFPVLSPHKWCIAWNGNPF